MTDTATAPAATAPTASACAGGACCSCPCAARVSKLEKTVRRIRIALWISLGVFIFLLGAAIGSDGAKKEMREHMRMMDAQRAGGQPGPQGHGPQGPGPQGPPPMANQGPGQQGPMGPGPDRRPEPRRDDRRR
jgi:hypothetical protein